MIKFCSRHFSKTVPWLMVAVVAWLTIVAIADVVLDETGNLIKIRPLAEFATSAKETR